MRVATTGAVLALLATPALAQEPIEGRWVTPRGHVVEITVCGEGFCLTALTGQRAGQRLGAVDGSGTHYEGNVVNPENGRTNRATFEVTDAGLTLKGCAGLICAERTWTRQ